MIRTEVPQKAQHQPSTYGDVATPENPKSSTQMPNPSLDDFGYEKHEPLPRASHPRRSSMKGSNPMRPPRRRHSIAFNEEVSVTPVVPIATKVKDKGDVWLQGEDYYKIINKVNAIVDQTASGKGQKYCVRGLENMIQRKVGTDEAPRGQAWDTVLDEQHIQNATGQHDEEMLSRKYISCSTQSRMEAKLRALGDEQDVSKYLKDTRRYCRRFSM